jgi:hypothetical protein
MKDRFEPETVAATGSESSGPDAHLPEVPLLDLGDAGLAALGRQAEEGARALLDVAARRYPRFLIRLGDSLSGRWLDSAGNPYRQEIAALAEDLKAPGVTFLNVNFEWGCTSGIAPCAAQVTPRLLRILDWRFEGLGRHLVAARLKSRAGAWLNLTWPGFLGVVQAYAPGRFAAALHQAPMRRHVPFMPLDWLINRWLLWQGRGLPPSHLLRRVFEEAEDFEVARQELMTVPLALPAIFLLVGCRPGEGCIIERTETQAVCHDLPQAAANHWLDPESLGAGVRDRPRGKISETRQALMAQGLSDLAKASTFQDLAWLEDPLINETTRLLLLADPARGFLEVRAYETEGPISRILRLEDGDIDAFAAAE